MAMQFCVQRALSEYEWHCIFEALSMNSIAALSTIGIAALSTNDSDYERYVTLSTISIAALSSNGSEYTWHRSCECQKLHE
jgi:hypothetical protein